MDLEQRFSRMAAHLPGFVFTFSLAPDGRFSFPYVSGGIRDIYGLQPEQVAEDMGLLHAMAHPDDREAIEAALADAVQYRGLFHIEFRIIHPDKRPLVGSQVRAGTGAGQRHRVARPDAGHHRA
ncbi:PAS domain-containing protein [Methylomonas koyamae]|uniref:PAS domain-containing protein n=1 Tax=Methylomonas koyamae TaxID=702114 RepID=UPI0021101CC2|nr:PAS domain-containing protein [Methylomonas koyamae]